MVGKPLRDHRAELPLHGDVDFGHQVDGAFLVDLEVLAELRHLEGAGVDDRLDGGGEEQRIGRHSGLNRSVGRARGLHTLDHADFHPASGARCSRTSSMKLRMRKMPGRSISAGSRDQAGWRPSPDRSLRLHRARGSRTPHVGSRRRLELDEDVFFRVVPVAMLDRVDHRLADRHADPVERVFVQPDATRKWSLTTCTKSSISKALLNSSRMMWCPFAVMSPSCRT